VFFVVNPDRNLNHSRCFAYFAGKSVIMKKVHIPSLPEVEQKSPTGKFHSFCRNVTLELNGGIRAGTWGGGHPFDVQIRRIPPSAAVCPFHSHMGQWEMFVVQSGNGTVRTSEGKHAIKTGDVFVHPPATPHQLINSGTVDLVVLIVADNPPLDACHYPDSNKWSLRPPGKIFRMTETDYFDGEEEPVVNPNAYRPAMAMPAPEFIPFAKRKVHLDDLKWEPWSSPKGKFGATSKELSIAVGALRNTPTGLGGHPFDLELARLPAGKAGCPFHSHSSQWELYVILSGNGTVRADNETGTVVAGDVVVHPPGEAHQLTNTGSVDLDYILVADNPPNEFWHYPDSNKFGMRSPRKIFRATDVDYHDGEE
jgi:uncharacterized cupin superfamily protein